MENAAGRPEEVVSGAIARDEVFREGWRQARLEAARELRHHGASELWVSGVELTHVTEEAKRRFEDIVDAYSATLAKEAARIAHDQGSDSTSATMVMAAANVLENARITTKNERLRRVGAALVTLGAVGAGTTSGFLHSPWQWSVFLVCTVIGITGLVLTW